VAQLQESPPIPKRHGTSGALLGLCLFLATVAAGARVHTIRKLNDYAWLVEIADGDAVVSFEGHRYARSEQVPLTILGPQYYNSRLPALFSAGSFVAVCMTEEFGEIKNWPPRARHFVFPDWPNTKP
jgi:hypothetical protein